MDARRGPGASRGAAAPRRHGVGEHVQPLRPGDAVRRHQGLGLRSRSRRRVASRLHPVEERLGQHRIAMDRLAYIICLTGDMPGMQWFYESAIGLPVRERAPDRVVFDTAGAALALHAMPDPERRGIQLRFATDDLDARVRALEKRGVRFDPQGIESYPWGRLAFAWDPEDNHFTLWQPAGRAASGAGHVLSASINCRDLAVQKRFYGEALGFAITTDSPWWVGLDVGEWSLGLHPRNDHAGSERHHGRPITIGLGVPDLAAWHDEARERGLAFTAAPSDRGYGVFADAVDPDGNEVTFRDVPEPEPIEEQLAEPFDDDAVPTHGAIRRSTRKISKAVSRVAIKPAYRGARSTARRKPSATTQAVAKPRGRGPEGSRVMPKRTADEKRA